MISNRSHLDIQDLEKQKQDLQHAKYVLDQERKQFTEAAVRMGIERAHLQVSI